MILRSLFAPFHRDAGAVAAASVAAVLALTTGLAAARSGPTGLDDGARRVATETGGDLRETTLRRMVARMDPAAAALARRFDPQARSLDETPYGLDQAPPALLRFLPVEGAEARRINSAIPFDAAAAAPAAPFVLKARNAAERERAVRCLANAIYYEAALEPVDGQRAVAQVVLNRVRDPNFPKSVCGVVYQGWERLTGCQFSFTCDGALVRPPIPVLWRETRAVAEAALGGYVQSTVGAATHYHADYVAPYWAPGLVKISQIGAHIFYRWPGEAGRPEALTAAYAGGEMRLSEAVLSGRAARPAPPPETPPGVKTVVVADASGRLQTRVQASFDPVPYGRRQATPEEIAQINALLEQRFPTRPPAAPPPAPEPPAPAAAPAAG